MNEPHDEKTPSTAFMTALLVVIASAPILGWMTAAYTNRPAPAAAVQSVPQDVIARTVVVMSTSGVGTGVRISPHGHILTCAHVLGGDTVVATEDDRGVVRPAEVLFVDAVRDLALLQTSEIDSAYAVIRYTKPPLGTHVWVVGTPLGFAFSVNDGRVSSYRILEKRHLMQLSATINPGNSGGPVVDNEGRVVGIAEVVYYDEKNAAVTPIGFAIDSQDIRAFLERFDGMVRL